MNVGIDVSGLFWKYRTGVQVLYYGLLEGLEQLDLKDSDMRFVFIDRSGQPGHSLPFRGGDRFELRSQVPLPFLPVFASPPQLKPLAYAADFWGTGVRVLRKRLARRREQVNRLLGGIDVLQVWNWDIVTAPGARHVITIPDVIPLVFPELFPKKFIDATRTSLEFAGKRADRVIAISEYTKRDLVEKGGIPEAKISVAYPGIRSVFRQIGDREAIREVLGRYGIHDRPYVLMVGFLDPRKNVQGHVRAFEILMADARFKDLQLVLVGPESIATSQVMRGIKSTGVRENIHITGFVPDEELVLLLNGARLFAYCSLYEGFGFPVVEAMACGIPVVTSNSTSLREVGGDAAILVNPEKSEEIADAMGRILSDDDLTRSLIARGLVNARRFTWEKWALGHVEAYGECCG